MTAIKLMATLALHHLTSLQTISILLELKIQLLTQISPMLDLPQMVLLLTNRSALLIICISAQSILYKYMLLLMLLLTLKAFTNKWLVVLLELALILQFGQSREQRLTMVRHYSMFSLQTKTIGPSLKVTGLQYQTIVTLDLVMITKHTTVSMTGAIINTKSWPAQLMEDGYGKTIYLDLVNFMILRKILVTSKTLWTTTQLHLMTHIT